jgi:hypothetical protein
LKVVDTLKDVLEVLSAKKEDFNALVTPMGSLILSDLQKLNQSAVVRFTANDLFLGTEI